MSEAHTNDRFSKREKYYQAALFGVIAALMVSLFLPTAMPAVKSQNTAVGQLDIGNQTAAIKSRVYEAYLLEDVFCRGQPEMKDNNFAYSDATTTHNGTMIHSEIVCYTQDNHAYKYPVDFDQQSHTINLQPPMTSQEQGPMKPA